jgi:uncharacterized membrane protein
MKQLFFTGLMLLLPFAITIALTIFVVNLLTSPFQEPVASLLKHYDSLNQPFLLFSARQILQFSSKMVVLAILFGIILLIGFLGRTVFMGTFFLIGDRILYRIPFFRNVYKTVQEIIYTILHLKSALFSQVVLVPFPNSRAYGIGLLSQTGSGTLPIGRVPVFIPSALNPTFGLVLLYKPEELLFIDMKVEDAMKLIVSCGAMFPLLTTGPCK